MTIHCLHDSKQIEDQRVHQGQQMLDQDQSVCQRCSYALPLLGTHLCSSWKTVCEIRTLKKEVGRCLGSLRLIVSYGILFRGFSFAFGELFRKCHLKKHPERQIWSQGRLISWVIQNYLGILNRDWEDQGSLLIALFKIGHVHKCIQYCLDPLL